VYSKNFVLRINSWDEVRYAPIIGQKTAVDKVKNGLTRFEIFFVKISDIFTKQSVNVRVKKVIFLYASIAAGRRTKG
jgi:hypothetical protein